MFNDFVLSGLEINISKMIYCSLSLTIPVNKGSRFCLGAYDGRIWLGMYLRLKYHIICLQSSPDSKSHCDVCMLFQHYLQDNFVSRWKNIFRHVILTIRGCQQKNPMVVKLINCAWWSSTSSLILGLSLNCLCHLFKEVMEKSVILSSGWGELSSIKTTLVAFRNHSKWRGKEILKIPYPICPKKFWIHHKFSVSLSGWSWVRITGLTIAEFRIFEASSCC